MRYINPRFTYLLTYLAALRTICLHCPLYKYTALSENLVGPTPKLTVAYFSVETCPKVSSLKILPRHFAVRLCQMCRVNGLITSISCTLNRPTGGVLKNAAIPLSVCLAVPCPVCHYACVWLCSQMCRIGRGQYAWSAG